MPAIATILSIVVCIKLIYLAPIWRIYLISSGLVIGIYWLKYYLLFKKQVLIINAHPKHPKSIAFQLLQKSLTAHPVEIIEEITQIKTYGVLLTVIWTKNKYRALVFIDSVPFTCYKQLRKLIWI
jgi:hypothetical protein